MAASYRIEVDCMCVQGQELNNTRFGMKGNPEPPVKKRPGFEGGPLVAGVWCQRTRQALYQL